MGWKFAIGVLLIGMTSFAQSFKTIEKGAFGGVDKPLQVVVTNQTQWAELWDKHSARKLPKPPPPEIDFKKESIIFVSMGQKNTGGYTIEISDIRRSGGKTEILVNTKEPKEGGLTIQALTAPFHIVAVPKIEGEVKFTVNKGA